MDPIALYIHIPFCRKKCPYCDFASWDNRADLIPAYLEALQKEIEYYGKQLNRPSVATVYFGGGTPSLLSGEQTAYLLDSVRQQFTLNPGAEITLESNPGTVDLGKLLGCRKAGVNRLSIGVQSFDDRDLKQLGRIHNRAEAVSCFHMAREAGFRNIGFDFIFGIPGQTLTVWEENLGVALDLRPEHLSTYNLQIEEGTPFYNALKNDAFKKVDEDREADMYESAIEMLTAAGYRHYEISNFALPGKECQHNLAYWKNKDYLGFGAAAHSHWQGKRYANPPDPDRYLATVEEENLEGLRLTEGLSKPGDSLFLGLRLLEGIDLTSLDPPPVYHEEINQLVSAGLLEYQDQKVRLSRKGILLGNEVFQRFV